MASLLERMQIDATPSAGPIRKKSVAPRPAPYRRQGKVPEGNSELPWTHDLYDANASTIHTSLSARLSNKSQAPKPIINSLAQRALRAATGAEQLNIKGAGSPLNGNVVDVTGLVAGTTADDVAAIFKRCGAITKAMSFADGDDVRIRVTFKTPASAAASVAKFHDQPADGKILSVRVVGTTSAGTTLGGRLGGGDGLGLVRQEGSVDVLMDTDGKDSSKMRSDSLLKVDPRAQVLLAPPGADVKEYNEQNNFRARDGPFRGRGGRRGGR